MSINLKLTIYNWKFWVVLIPALIFMVLAAIPKSTIMVLELIISGVELVNFGERHSKHAKRILTWVHKG